VNRKLLAAAAVISWAALVSPSSAAAQGPEVVFLKAFLDKLVLDPAWDFVLGKTDRLKPLERRLQDLGKNGALRSEVREELRKLRESLNDRVTRDEFQRMVERTTNQLRSIQERLDDLEERVEKLEVENSDLKNGTTNASSAEFFRMRANRFAEENRTHRAFANFSIALKLDPSLVSAYRDRCTLYERLSAWGMMALDANEALRHAKGDAAWIYRARALGRGKALELRPYFDNVASPKIDEAEKTQILDDCERALSANKADIPILCLRGMLRIHVGGSVRFSSNVVGNFSLTNEQVNAAIADLNARRKPWFEGAKADFTAALQADGQCAAAYCGRGVAHTWLFQYDAAFADYAEAIRLEPRTKDAYICRAQVPREHPTRIEDLRTALDIDPTDTFAANLLKQRTGR
jgi:tetratricopeptide (TPR) repeat protein